MVHRDLKPGNILVTPDGTVKLLDFGIAKLLDAEHSDELPETVSMVQIMTPDYASPEQARREMITTLTDVYSLGVVLYELLTGHRPYDLSKAAMHEVARVISEDEPSRPSDIVTTYQNATESGKQPITPLAIGKMPEGDVKRLRKCLRGDLDSIILTTLRKEPARRYSSVEAFSEDLHRHLESRPIRAHADSFWYRAGRFARRNPAGFTAGIVIALLMVAAVWEGLWETRLILETAQQHSYAPGTLLPQGILWLSAMAASLLMVIYLSRAMPRRIVGALAGGSVVAFGSLFKMRLDLSVGWWQSRFAEIPNPVSLFSYPMMFLIIVFGGAGYLLVMWRVTRRFGWVGQIVIIAWIGFHLALKERLWFDISMGMITMSFGPYAFAVDAALWIAGFAIGYALMRLIAGRAAADGLAPKSLSLKISQKL